MIEYSFSDPVLMQKGYITTNEYMNWKEALGLYLWIIKQFLNNCYTVHSGNKIICCFLKAIPKNTVTLLKCEKEFNEAWQNYKDKSIVENKKKKKKLQTET